ncbi:ankyrin repeat and death domain-containing protein 1B isoform X1 [Acanthopagrus latus]|uniref:ankyrin repeat and death domain-containing protein 1B isoform X1 n=1 Tax=Acanthopagrus latus TaxID=8177 RepID=UPI00187C08EC|nr:ankyrin repeat and death domain-containing protein 1B isoform X1 [Acanthopagrus latus]
MERRALALKEMVEKRCPKKETLDPRKWVRQETMKGFVDFVLNRDSDDTDSSFDSKEMLLYTEKQFMEAAKRNDVEAMKVLGKGLNANAKNVDNRTALHYAVAGKNKEAVQFLLQRRVRVDQKDKHGVAPIHLAAWFGSLEILKLLVQAGAEQKVKNEEGLNILHCAAINNHTDILEYIVNDLQMKELDKDDLSGNRPFALAAEHGCAEMLDMLMVPYEMATMKPNKRGDTPLHLAARNDQLEAVQLLLQTLDTQDEVNMDGETALYQAADKGQERCVRALLEAGCDPNILTTAKCSALHSVSEKGDTSLVQLLLEYKAHTDFKNQYQEAPLHLAVKNSHIPVIHSLLKAGCDSNITNKRSQTAMHLAAELGKIEVVEMLLKAGLDLTLCDQQGKTALGVAARADEVIIVDMIIKAERYYAWRTANPELNDSLHNEYPLTFKLDHRHETKQLRSMAWRLAYELLKPGDWKRLAEHWGFNKEQVSAIEEQWTGQHSYKEHGNRMLLIWLHGEVFAQRSPAKKIYQDLILTGNRKAADKIWMEEENASSKICSIS